jgi:hypothetical protein
MLRTLIRREFRVSLSAVNVGRLLRTLGLSPQRPLWRAWQADPDAVQRWRDEDFPAIRAQGKAEGATVYFGDEAGIRSDHHTQAGHTVRCLHRRATATVRAARLLPAAQPRRVVLKNLTQDRVGRTSVTDADDFKVTVICALRRLQKAPHIVRAVFRRPHQQRPRPRPRRAEREGLIPQDRARAAATLLGRESSASARSAPRTRSN